MKLQQDLRAFIESLNFTRAEFVIVGGYAVAFHGYPRFTGDIDVFVGNSPENAERVARAIEHFGFESLGLQAADFSKPDAIIQIGFPPNRIDIITAIDGVSFAEAWKDRVPSELDGLPVSFISRALLIRNKQAAGRPQDIADIANL